MEKKRTKRNELGSLKPKHYTDFYDNVKLSEDGKHLVLTKPKKSVEAILKKDDE